MKCIENLTGNYSSSARVVDGTLIISLPQAITPVVWRMELGYVRASALEVRNHENGTFVLVLKTPKGDVNDIAPFETKGRAVQALMSVSRAMEQAHGQMQPQAANISAPTLATTTAKPSGSTKGRVITSIIGTVLLLMLIAFLLNMGPAYEGAPGSTEPNATAHGDAPAKTGVPLSADDFLNNR